MKITDKLEAKRCVAFLEMTQKVEAYRQWGFDNNLCTTIFKKKNELIKNAKSIEEINKIMNGPVPFDDSEYSVPEEEAIMWSELSLRAPLNAEATERYISLVKGIYGDGVLEGVL